MNHLPRFLTFGLFFMAIVIVIPATTQGQGVLLTTDQPTPLPRPIVPPRTTQFSSYKITHLAIHAKLLDQVAQVQVSQTFVNMGNRQMEVCFVFPLPYDSAINQMTFMVDGKEYRGKIFSADKARSIYEGFIRRNQDPALLEWIGAGMFKTSVFPVPPGAERQVTLRYSQLLRKDHGMTDFLFPLSTAQYTSTPVENIDIQISIESSSEIKSIYSPTHIVNIERTNDKRAVVKYQGEDQLPTSDFRLFFDTATGQLNTSVLSYCPTQDRDGYFLLLASPTIDSANTELPNKNVVFVVDRSGSMTGKKIEQSREALKFVLNNLRDGDLFNIIAYDSAIESCHPELQQFNEEAHQKALGFIAGIYAGGATNIEGALNRALDMFETTDQPNFVVFLTDGRPTAGETNESKIVSQIHEANNQRVRLISFGVGYDVNSRLLDRLSRENFGQTEYVRPNDDIETHISRLYRKISTPIMTDVLISFEMDTLSNGQAQVTNRLYPQQTFDLFQGEQLVISGRYRQGGAARVVITGKLGGHEHRFDFPATLVGKSEDESLAFVEKLWAIRRIGAIIDELDLLGQNDELITELVSLSTRHGILTQYTSYLADDTGTVDDLTGSLNGRLHIIADVRKDLERLTTAGGRIGFSQRAEKNRLRSAESVAPVHNNSHPTILKGIVGQRSVFRDSSDNEVVAESVVQLQAETLYRRGNTWFAASAMEDDLDQAEREKQIHTVTRFSDEYFTLVKTNTAAENQLLARQIEGEDLIVKLRGRLYRIQSLR